MSSDQTTSGVLTRVAQLDVALKAELSSRARAIRTARTVSIVLSGTILFFVAVNFAHLRSSLTEENFKVSIENEMREFSPFALHEVSGLAEALLPVYAQESQKQLAAMLPEIAATVEREIDLLCNDVLSTTQTRLQQSQDRIVAKTQEATFAAYPSLKDEAERTKLERRLREITDRAALRSITEFDRLFSKDVDEVRRMLLEFDVSDTNETAFDLRKKFLRLTLQLLDQEIEEL